MSTQVELHGGPRHGEQRSLPDPDARVLWITAPLLPSADLRGFDAAELDAPIQVRKGRYSAVSGAPGMFEWDGWLA